MNKYISAVSKKKTFPLFVKDLTHLFFLLNRVITTTVRTLSISLKRQNNHRGQMEAIINLVYLTSYSIAHEAFCLDVNIVNEKSIEISMNREIE